MDRHYQRTISAAQHITLCDTHMDRLPREMQALYTECLRPACGFTARWDCGACRMDEGED